MKCIDNTTPRRMYNLIPEDIRNRSYVKLNLGELKTIDYVCYSVYNAKDKETGEHIFRKDGSEVFKVTAYVGFTDNTYTTMSSNAVIDQLITETGNFPDELGQWAYTPLDVPVKVIQTKAKYGDKEYPVTVFEPVNAE